MVRSGKRKDTPPEDEDAKRLKTDADAATDAGDSSPTKAPPKKRTGATAGKASYNSDDMVLNFDHYLFKALAVKAETGNFHISKDEHPDLYGWMQFLKKEFKSFKSSEEGEGGDKAQAAAAAKDSLLTAEQVKVLEHLHIPLTSRGDDHWNRFYELLKDYGNRHGHVLVPRLCEVPGLGDWVTDQRRQYKAWKQGQASQLSKDRRDKLEALGKFSLCCCSSNHSLLCHSRISANSAFVLFQLS